MKFSFFLKDSQKDSTLLYLVARSGNERIKISTGFTITTKSWSTVKARVKPNNAGQELNFRLDKIEAAAKEIYNRARVLEITETMELFKYIKNGIVESGLLDRRSMETTTIQSAIVEFQKQLKEGTRPSKRRIGKTVSYSYLQLFQTVENTLIAILPDKAPFTYLNTKEFASKLNEHRTKQWSDVSALKYILLIRRFLLWCKDSHLYNFEEFPHILTLPEEHESTLFALTDDELRSIENLDLSDRPALDKVRDLFLISCYTGLRYSDVSRLGAEHIGTNEIGLSTKKTGDNVRCPITPRLRKVLDKYAPGYIFNKISSQRANEHLKLIARKAEIIGMMEMVTYKFGQKVVEVKPKCDLIAWHCSRRTFITLSLVKGVQPMAVQSVSGHKKDSKAFNRYVKFADNQVDAQMNSAWD
ncbi:MAG: integrase catalytic domain-containing protein [Ignavibacteria bacterium]|nr:integrase catalytic domain-containing protein [Ignavibacteria bacterium]